MPSTSLEETCEFGGRGVNTELELRGRTGYQCEKGLGRGATPAVVGLSLLMQDC